MIISEKQNKWIDKKISKMNENQLLDYTIDTHKASKFKKIGNFRKAMDLKCFMILVKNHKNNTHDLFLKIKKRATPEYSKAFQAFIS